MSIIPFYSICPVICRLPLHFPELLGLIVLIVASFKLPGSNIQEPRRTVNSRVIHAAIEFADFVGFTIGRFFDGFRRLYFWKMNRFIKLLCILRKLRKSTLKDSIFIFQRVHDFLLLLPQLLQLILDHFIVLFGILKMPEPFFLF